MLVVLGILAADDSGWLMLALLVAGALLLTWFFAWIRGRERAVEGALLSSLPRSVPHAVAGSGVRPEPQVR
ncbi:hypothetical protein [Egicoccus sp. AB-alg2]|uniref:hypothetical protein n=1 Tax=Egicoccus sp. AB-alg2 TaxID=3242693 RepID=UPI00359E7625